MTLGTSIVVISSVLSFVSLALLWTTAILIKRHRKNVMEERTKLVPPDSNQADWVLDQWLQILKQVQLGPYELILVSSNILYSIGASLEGYKGKGPSPEEVLQMYYTNPTLGVAMMAQALQMNQEWIASLERLAKRKKNEQP